MILDSQRTPINQVSVIGAGQVFQQRFLQAAIELARDSNLAELTVFDLKDKAPFEVRCTQSLQVRYRSLNPEEDLCSQLRRAGALGNHTLAIIATPTMYHVDNAYQLAGHVRCLAVEKPIAIDPINACRLREFTDRIAPIDHQLYKPEMLSLIRDARRGAIPWSTVAGMEFRLCEMSAVGNRQIDDAIYDLGYHGLACMLVSLRTSLFQVEIRIDKCEVATYVEGPDDPTEITAARIEGRFQTRSMEIPFVISVGKGLAKNQKGLRLCDRQNSTIRQASLNERGHFAHMRFMRSVIDPGDQTGQLIDVNDSIQIVQACADALAIARVMPTYRLGETPPWLTKQPDFTRSRLSL